MAVLSDAEGSGEEDDEDDEDDKDDEDNGLDAGFAVDDEDGMGDDAYRLTACDCCCCAAPESTSSNKSRPLLSDDA